MYPPQSHYILILYFMVFLIRNLMFHFQLIYLQSSCLESNYDEELQSFPSIRNASVFNLVYGRNVVPYIIIAILLMIRRPNELVITGNA